MRSQVLRLFLFSTLLMVGIFNSDILAQSQFSLSPDGSKIAFSSGKNGQSQIFLMRNDGTQVKQLTFTKEDKGDPVFTPDGKNIVYVSGSSETKWGQIYIMDSDGKNPRRITKNTYNEIGPSFSTDGSKITFVRAHRHRPYSMGGHIWVDWDLYTMNINSTDERRITNNNYYLMTAPYYSPDSKRIVFAALVSDFHLTSSGEQIFVVNSDGSIPLQQLTENSKKSNRDPSFSPDGTKIVFVSNKVSQAGIYDYEVWIMDSDGANPIQITHNHSANSSPVFTPDGKNILFLSDMKRNDKFELWRVNIDGTNLQRIAHLN